MIRSWRRSALLVLLVVVLLATGSCGGGGSGATSRTAERMIPLIERMMAEDQVTGAAIVLVDDQKVVWPGAAKSTVDSSSVRLGTRQSL